MKQVILSEPQPIPHSTPTHSEQVFYIGGLHSSTTDSDLFSHFESCGDIHSVKLLKHPSGSSKKTAILKISPSSLDSVLSLDRSSLNSKKIRVRLYSKQKNENQSKTESCIVFVGNIPCLSNEDSIGAVFEQFGSIKEIRMIRRADGKLKGSCYVEFVEADAAQKALQMNNSVLDGKVLRVDLAEAKFVGKKSYTRPYYWALDIN